MDIRELIHTEYPIIQGGMANIATGEFAAAVSNAGALGLIASGGDSAEQIREQIHICRHNTDKPFGVNVMLMNPDVENIARMLCEERVQVITTGAGNPGRFIKGWKDCGAVVIPVTASVSLAKLMLRSGADALVAEGGESGGHVGDMTTMALLPQMVKAYPDIPIVAAGGIASGRQLAAAYIMGAAGAQIGTCLLVSEECPIHPDYKKALIKAKDNGTTVTGRSLGAPVRILKNKMAREYLRLESEGATKEELELLTLGGLRKAVYDGDVEMGSVMAGQVCGQLDEIRPVKVIIEELCNGAMEALNAAPDMIFAKK